MLRCLGRGALVVAVVVVVGIVVIIVDVVVVVVGVGVVTCMKVKEGWWLRVACQKEIQHLDLHTCTHSSSQLMCTSET